MRETAGTITLPPGADAPRAGVWRARAVREYERSLPARRAGLSAEITARVSGLTGRHLARAEIHVSADGSVAHAGVDGTRFRLYRHGNLVLVRPCAHCGTGEFESPRLSDLADLGHALGHGTLGCGWWPLHENCADHYGAQDP